MKRPEYLRSVYLTSIAFAMLPIGSALYAARQRTYDLRYLILALGLSAVVGAVMTAARAQERPPIHLLWCAVAAGLVGLAVAEVVYRTTSFGPPTPLPHFHSWALGVSISWALSFALDTFARFDGRGGRATRA